MPGVIPAALFAAAFVGTPAPSGLSDEELSTYRHDRGGHFAAWEQPELLSEDVRTTFRSLR